MRFIGLSVSTPVLLTGAKGGAFALVADPRRGEIVVDEMLQLVCAGISCRLPPFSCSRTHRRITVLDLQATTVSMRAKA
jgi:hypothetical protein